MKKLLVSALLGSMLALNAQAGIKQSELESRHLGLIESAVNEKCSIYGDLVQTDVKSENVRVDQGITDVYYTVQLEGKVRVDQMIFDVYDITVKTALFDQYDHSTGNWGSYEVLSVDCRQR